MNEQNYEKVYDPIAARERRATREKLHRRKQQRRRRMVRRLVALCLAVVLTVCAVPPLCNRAEQLLYPRKYEQLVEKWAATYELDPLLVYAFIRTESGFDPQATSSVDARGLMQMTEETFLWMRSKIAPNEPLTFADLYSPDTAIRLGAIICTFAWCATKGMYPRRQRPTTAAGARWISCCKWKNTRQTGKRCRASPITRCTTTSIRSPPATRPISVCTQVNDKKLRSKKS